MSPSGFRTCPADRGGCLARLGDDGPRGQDGSAARLWCAAGLRVVNAGKSRYYPAALENFARARRCYQAAGRQAGWLRVVAEIRDRHSRKSGFMRDFEDLAEQAGPVTAPSFLENARARWIPPS